MKNIIIITGASSGFGQLFAIELDRLFTSIDEYWLIARKTDQMLETSKAIKTPCRILSFDLSVRSNVKEIIKNVERYSYDCEDDVNIKMLINCAGYGKLGDFATIDEEYTEGMIDVNITALTCITRDLLPYMRKNSRIINIASAAAFLPQPGFAEYAATKSYVLSLSRALNVELRHKKIYVTAVCPGPAKTNFFNIAEENASAPWYKKFFYAEPKKVVDKAIKDCMRKKEVSVYSISMNLLRFFTKIIPHRIILKLYR